MIETTLFELTKAGGTELFLSSGAKLLEKVKNAKEIKQVFVNAGEFILEYENNGGKVFDDMAYVLSKENMTKLANELKNESGYRLKDRLLHKLLLIMQKYDIPHDVAQSYANLVLFAILGQLAEVDPDKYDRVYLANWKEEQEKGLREIAEKIEKVNNELLVYANKQIKIKSADSIDLEIRKQTHDPQISLDFFEVDDDSFKELLIEKKNDEIIYIRARCREEAIYCTVNELWRQGEKRPIFIVQSEEDWDKLAQINDTDNIYIPWFLSDQITAISGNTNIFILSEDTPSFKKDEITLRPRTYTTIAEALQRAGMGINESYELVQETHGLYIPLMKKIYYGAYLIKPRWLNELSRDIILTALLVGQWTDNDGDKTIIEALSGISYSEYITAIEKYSKDEDPFVYIVNTEASKSYFLASVENTWDYIDVSVNSEIWKKFKKLFIEVINESEKLFTYSAQDKLAAQFRGEKLFWSSSIRKGMIRSLIMKAYYKNDMHCQWDLDVLVKEIFDYISTAEQWHYISHFFVDLCEVSPKAVINKLEEEEKHKTGLYELFAKQSEDFIFGRNDYIKILWGIEEFLGQREYALRGFDWILLLDNKSYEYKSNAPKDIINKVLCTWYNFSVFSTCREKIDIANRALEKDKNAWKHIFEALPTKHRSILGTLHAPRYREHVEDKQMSSVQDIRQISLGYIELLISHADFKPDRWNSLLSIYDEVAEDTRKVITEKLLYEMSQMTDDEKVIIKDYIRGLVYKHRYYSTAEWAMGEEKLGDLIQILNAICFSEPEYEYAFYFKSPYDGILLDPVPYDEDDKMELNERKVEELYASIVKEIKSKSYDIKKLAEICNSYKTTTLGRVLSQYWNNSTFDRDVFLDLYNSQEKHEMALAYMEGIARQGTNVFSEINELAGLIDISQDFWIYVYRVEALYSEGIPLISSASKEMRKDFWKNFSWHTDKKINWALDECSKYGDVNSYLELLYRVKKKEKMSSAELFEKLSRIEKMERGDSANSMVEYYLKELLRPIQDDYIYDEECSSVIAHIELAFFYLLTWEEMRCFQIEIKRNPSMYAEMASIIFRKDGCNDEERKTEEYHQYVQVIWKLYDMAKFCPGEHEGKGEYKMIKNWVDKFILLLDANHQKDLFGMLLGRLLSYSPIGEDNFYPCESVRRIIEEYADESMIQEYECEVFNKRGIFTPSAGRAEKEMATNFKSTADYLCVKYPKTAEIYFRLYRRYMSDSEMERLMAENGRY